MAAAIEAQFVDNGNEPESTDEPELKTKTIPLGGRDVLIRALSDTQITQMNHEILVLESDRTDLARKRKAMDRVYRALQSTIVSEEDRDFAADLMADGELDLRQMMRESMELWGDRTPANRQIRRGRAPRRK